MSLNKTSKSQDKVITNKIIIVLVVIGLIATFVTAYFGIQANTASSVIKITTSSSLMFAVTPAATYPAECMKYETPGVTIPDNEFSQVAECYKFKATANPGDFLSLAKMAGWYGNAKQYDKMAETAQVMIAVAHNTEEKAEAILQLGVAYYKLGDYASAIKTLSLGTDFYYYQTSSYFNISVWLSRSYEANGETKKACEQYRATVILAQQKNLTHLIDEYQSGVQRNCQ